ncbi:MAG: hypothetical protein EOM00_14580 [Clostridia bacterium]|nr:hypothetical protein [Clostridia bacterium]
MNISTALLKNTTFIITLLAQPLLGLHLQVTVVLIVQPSVPRQSLPQMVCSLNVGGKIMLYKSGTEGFANSGKEPYSEFYACQIAAAMGINAVKYNLSVWKGKLCSTCELFTDIDTIFRLAGLYKRVEFVLF